VQYLKQTGFLLESSVGTASYEIITALGVIYNLPMRLHIIDRGKFTSDCERLLQEFSLDRSRVELSPVLASEDKKLSIEHCRDRQVVESSDLILPLSVRPDAFLAKIATEKCNHRATDYSFEIPYNKNPPTIATRYDADPVCGEFGAFDEDMLIHWTRARSCPWPAETKIDFYRSLLQSQIWPRDVFATLRNMLDTQTIVGSSRHMPNNAATVSFSSNRPMHMLPLMRYRARYREMSFEPYGIGIERSYAESIGCRPVHYRKRRDAADSLSVQSEGRVADWKDESEYRLLGDCDLSMIPKSRMRLFCRYRDEAQLLQERCGIKTISLTDLQSNHGQGMSVTEPEKRKSTIKVTSTMSGSPS
jgi:hypothetical protein